MLWGKINGNQFKQNEILRKNQAGFWKLWRSYKINIFYMLHMRFYPFIYISSLHLCRKNILFQRHSLLGHVRFHHSNLICARGPRLFYKISAISSSYRKITWDYFWGVVVLFIYLCVNTPWHIRYSSKSAMFNAGGGNALKWPDDVYYMPSNILCFYSFYANVGKRLPHYLSSIFRNILLTIVHIN